MPEETVPFDRDELYEVIQQTGGFLAELAYIDSALEYIRQRDQRYNPAVPPDRHEEITIQLGQLYPFTRVLVLEWNGQSQQPAVSRDLAGIAEQANTWAEREVETLIYHAGWITHPELHTYDRIVHELEGVHDAMERGRIETDAKLVEGILNDWKGDAATDFRRNFYTPLQQIHKNQTYIVDQTARLFAYSKAVARLAQHSLMTAAVHTRKALREQLKKRMEDNQGPSTKDVMILASNALSLMSAFGFPFYFDAARPAELLDFAALHIPESAAEPYEISGTSADKLCNDLFDATRQISRNAREGYRGLEDEIHKLTSKIDDFRADDLLVPRRPDLVDGVDSNDFHHKHSSSEYQG